MKYKKQKGFVAVEMFLILVILTIICFTGWYVWHSKSQIYKTSSNAVYTPTNSGTAPNDNLAPTDFKVYKYPITNKDNKVFSVYESDGKTQILSRTLYNVYYLATNEDQKAIAYALQAACIANYKKYEKKTPAANSIFAYYEDKNYFTNQELFKMDGNWARIESYCINTKSEEQQGGGVDNVLNKKSNGTWAIIITWNGIHDCKDWDGLGIPVSFNIYCEDQTHGRLVKP